MNTDEIRRHREFLQVRSTIRGSRKHLIAGIDVGKEKHYAFFGLATGKTLYKRLIFENSRDGFEKLVAQIEVIKARHNLTGVVIGVEPTASYHKPLAHFLTEKDYLVVLVAGTAVKHNRELLDGRWDKNDTKDAANIADLISQGKFLFLENPSVEIASLRELLSLQKRLKKEQRSLKVRIRNCLLAKYFPELDRSYGRAELENLAIIKWCLNPEKIAAMDYKQFSLMVTTCKKGLSQEKRLRAIQNAAAGSVGCPFSPAAEFEAKMLAEKIEQIRESLKKTDAAIHAICLSIPGYHRLLTIPGFGPFISAMVLAKIGNPYRFQNRSQVVRLSGYDLCASRSGKTALSKIPVLSKRGSGDLRYALYQAAFVASTHDVTFMRYFTKLLKGREAEKGIRVKMRVKMAAKMLVIAWTMLKRDEDFNPELIRTDIIGEAN